jgi:hypothetical protein
VIEQLHLAANEKSLAQIILNTPMYPTDSNGRDRIFEIEDILHRLDEKGFRIDSPLESRMVIGGVILALLELYNINEQDFLEVWNHQREIAAPKAENKARKLAR